MTSPASAASPANSKFHENVARHAFLLDTTRDAQIRNIINHVLVNRLQYARDPDLKEMREHMTRLYNKQYDEVAHKIADTCSAEAVASLLLEKGVLRAAQGGGSEAEIFIKRYRELLNELAATLPSTKKRPPPLFPVDSSDVVTSAFKTIDERQSMSQGLMGGIQAFQTLSNMSPTDDSCRRIVPALRAVVQEYLKNYNRVRVGLKTFTKTVERSQRMCQKYNPEDFSYMAEDSDLRKHVKWLIGDHLAKGIRFKKPPAPERKPEPAKHNEGVVQPTAAKATDAFSAPKTPRGRITEAMYKLWENNQQKAVEHADTLIQESYKLRAAGKSQEADAMHDKGNKIYQQWHVPFAPDAYGQWQQMSKKDQQSEEHAYKRPHDEFHNLAMQRMEAFAKANRRNVKNMKRGDWSHLDHPELNHL